MNINVFFSKYPLLFLQLFGWGIYLLADLLDHIAQGYFVIIPSLLSSSSGFLLTGCVAYFTNKLNDKGALKQSVFFAFFLLIAIVIWHKIFTVIHGDAETWSEIFNQFYMMKDYSLLQWLSTGYYPLFAFVAWGGLFAGAKWYFAHQQQQIALNHALLTTKQAQLETLRYQLNPHFLFNVLNSIDISILSDDKETAHQMVLRLSGFLRNSLEFGEQDKIPLHKELAIIKDFSDIEQLRFGDSLELSVQMEVGCENVLLPSMILQPLMENAIKFAWSQTKQGIVSVVASRVGNYLKIELINSLAQNGERIQGTGIGLKNTQDRLSLVYAKDASLSTKETLEQYIVELTLPWEIDFS